MGTLCSFIRLVTIFQAAHCHDPEYKLNRHHCVIEISYNYIEMNRKILGFGSMGSIEISIGGRVLC